MSHTFIPLISGHDIYQDPDPVRVHYKPFSGHLQDRWCEHTIEYTVFQRRNPSVYGGYIAWDLDICAKICQALSSDGLPSIAVQQAHTPELVLLSRKKVGKYRTTDCHLHYSEDRAETNKEPWT